MKEFYLDRNKKIAARLNDRGEVDLDFRGKDKNGSEQNILSALKRILQVETIDGTTSIKLDGVEFVRIRNDRVVKKLSILSNETEHLGLGIDKKLYARHFLDGKRISSIKTKTNLHTHFPAELSGDEYIRLGLRKGLTLTENFIKNYGYAFVGLNAQIEKPPTLATFLRQNKNNRQILTELLELDTTSKSSFDNLEGIYIARDLFTSGSNGKRLFIPTLEAIVKKHPKKAYCEISTAHMFKGADFLKPMHDDNIPIIQGETEVKLRFLASIGRHDLNAINEQKVDMIKSLKASPYIVGCDFLGEELNKTSDFAHHLKTLTEHALEREDYFTIRVHAGETNRHEDNILEALTIIQQTIADSGKDGSKICVRIGHGIHGVTPQALEKMKELQTVCGGLGVMVECNISSNFLLNNIDKLEDLPIRRYLDNDIRIALGTDGSGIYATSPCDEIILAHFCGVSRKDFERIKETEEKLIELKTEAFITKNKARQKNEKKFNKELAQVKELDKESDEVIQERIQLKAKHKPLHEELASVAEKNNISVVDKQKLATHTKGLILYAGPTPEQLSQMSEQEKKKLRLATKVFVKSIDPEKYTIISDGQQQMLNEEIVKQNQTCLQKRKLESLAVITAESFDENKKLKICPQATSMVMPVAGNIDGTLADYQANANSQILQQLNKKKGVGVFIAGQSNENNMFVDLMNTDKHNILLVGLGGATDNNAKINRTNVTKIDTNTDGYELQIAEELKKQRVMDYQQDTEKIVEQAKFEMLSQQEQTKRLQEEQRLKEQQERQRRLEQEQLEREQALNPTLTKKPE